MTKPIIAIDIDDVLADHATGFTSFSNKQWGTDFQPSDYDEHWAKLWNLEDDINEINIRRDIFVESQIYNYYAPIDDAKETLHKLSQTHELCIITSRLSIMKADTVSWVRKYYQDLFDESSVHFAGIWDTLSDNSHLSTKTDVIQSIGASYLIDDQLKHCESASRNGVKALLFGNYNWNQADVLPNDVTRVGNWSEVMSYFYE